MQLFVCEVCGCVDCLELAPSIYKDKLVCSACRPNGEWHNQFERKAYDPLNDFVINRPSVQDGDDELTISMG